MLLKSLILPASTSLILALGIITSSAQAAPENYVIDTEGGHASINFKTKHLGISWLTGRFDEFDGTFTFDEANPKANKITVNINADSINSGHAKRDAHLKSAEMLDTAKHPKASFVSTSIMPDDDDYIVIGDLTLNGVTKEIRFEAEQTGVGQAMGKFRRGFEGDVDIYFSDFGYTDGIWKHLAKSVELTLYIEGLRQ